MTEGVLFKGINQETIRSSRCVNNVNFHSVLPTVTLQLHVFKRISKFFLKKFKPNI